jgi:hypothetical protein
MEEYIFYRRDKITPTNTVYTLCFGWQPGTRYTQSPLNDNQPKQIINIKHMLIDNFNKTIDVWIDELQHYSINKLLIKPDTASWSMGQLYMHVIEETNWYFEQIGLCFDSKEHLIQTMKESAKSIFQNDSFPDDIIKGDPFISDNVNQPTDWQTLQVDFHKLKKDANEIWLEIEKAAIPGKAEHPGLGFLGPLEWFQYAEMHMRHHAKQKGRINNFLETMTAK